jgi:hypothetical protein
MWLRRQKWVVKIVKILNLREVFLYFRNQIRKLKYKTKIPLNMQYYIFLNLWKKVKRTLWVVTVKSIYFIFILILFHLFRNIYAANQSNLKRLAHYFQFPMRNSTLNMSIEKTMIFEWNVRNGNRAYSSATTWYIRSKLCPFFGIDPRIQIKIKCAAKNAKKYAKYWKICW